MSCHQKARKVLHLMSEFHLSDLSYSRLDLFHLHSISKEHINSKMQTLPLVYSASSGDLWRGARARIRWRVLHPLHPLLGTHAGPWVQQPGHPAGLGCPHPLQLGRRSVVWPRVGVAFSK